MANKYVNVEFDKFTNKTEIKMKYEYLLAGNAVDVNFGANIRHISVPEGEKLMIDIFSYSRDSWFFLRHGNLIININNSENIVLEPHESYAAVINHKCQESDYYEINKEILKKICEANSVEFKISGEKSFLVSNCSELEEYPNEYIEIYCRDNFGKLDLPEESISFITFAQRFYNGVYDENAYTDAIIQKNLKKSSSCCVTLLFLISILTLTGGIIYKTNLIPTLGNLIQSIF